MNRKWLAMVGAVLAMSLSACGGNPCATIKAANDRVSAGKTSCTSGGTTVTFKDVSASCNMSLSKCSTSDVTTLDDYAKCLNAVPPCTAGNEDRAASGAAACVFTHLPKLSTDCSAAFK